jgi:hypothetical protein
MRTVPLTQEHHGLLIRASLLAARELHEWLTRWNGIYKRLEVGLDFEFVSLSDRVPDTNIVTFIVKKTTSPSLKELNELTERVYSHFAIQTELGEMEYSYSQPFFISRTQMTNANYPVAELESLFERCGLGARARVEYGENGVTVLRAAVMNPYLLAMRSGVNHDLIRMFVEELARVASDECRSLNGSNSDSTKPIR